MSKYEPFFPFLDVHAHIQFAAYDADRQEIIARAFRSGVRLVNIGTEGYSSRRAVEVAEAYEDDVYAAVGLHPAHTGPSYYDADELGGGDVAQTLASKGEEFDYGYYKKLAGNPKVVAIGECGLDYYRMDGDSRQATTKKKQKDAFCAQIELSKEINKPLMIHSRGAFSDTLDILKTNGAKPGIAHSFVRTIDEARAFLDLGFYFTFAGNITFKPRADKPSADEVIKFIPIDRILSETDAPYLAPVPYRGTRNEPVYVIEVVKKLAELKNVSTEEMADAIARNAKRILGI
jgi:TatD DNase family protein